MVGVYEKIFQRVNGKILLLIFVKRHYQLKKMERKTFTQKKIFSLIQFRTFALQWHGKLFTQNSNCSSFSKMLQFT